MKKVALALQGGGAHGAFTWGVLDRLLEEPDLDIQAISGTSAGALNGAALKSGLVQGGADGAKSALEALWQQVGAVDVPGLSTWMNGIPTDQISQSLELSPAFAWADAAARVFSPYGSGPFYSNPLRPIVDQFDFDRVCADCLPDLHVCATAVRSGKVRIFRGTEITTDAILASACLPTLFRAIEIESPETGEREPYWDGGYTGNPALFPLYSGGDPVDIVIININPLERADTPVTPQQIQNRINEISFNSSLLREVRAISFVQRLLDDGTLPEGRMARVRVHMIADDDLMNDLSVATKLIPNPVVLSRLKSAGRSAAERFLNDHKSDIGVRSSVDMAAMLQ